MSFTSKTIASRALNTAQMVSVLSTRSIRQQAMMSLCVVPARTISHNVQFLQKAMELASRSENSSNHGRKGSFYDLAIWLALIAQLCLYVSVVRPRQKERHLKLESACDGREL